MQLCEWLDQIPRIQGREAAWKAFGALGLPKKEEAFCYLPLTQLYSAAFLPVESSLPSIEEIRSYVHEECRHSFLVLVDGVYHPLLSDVTALPEQLVILPLQKAQISYGNFLQSRAQKALKEEKDPFAALNTAVHRDGVFLFVPPKLRVETPVQIIYIATEALSFPRVHIALGSSSYFNWIATPIYGKDRLSYISSLTDVSLDERAEANHTHLSLSSSETWHFDALRVSLKKEARFNAVSAAGGAKTVRHDIKVDLNGEGAEAVVEGLSVLEKHQQSHVHALMRHLAPHTRSMQCFKSVLKGVSRSSFTGKIWVDRLAQKTEAYQLNKNLILDEACLANSRPNLEIFADDVKASHGATFGQLDAAHLFYLQTRGIPKPVAEWLQIKGFCKEVVDKIALPSAHAAVQRMIEHVLSV